MSPRSPPDDCEVYEAPLRYLSAHPLWDVAPVADTIADAAAKAADGDYGEVLFDTQDFDARLHAMTVGGVPRRVLELVLDCTLDPRLPRSETAFVGSLAEAHAAIARKHATDLVTSVADPSVVLTATLPQSYGDDDLAELREAVTAAARETDGLHREIRAPLGDYVEEPSDAGG